MLGNHMLRPGTYATSWLFQITLMDILLAVLIYIIFYEMNDIKMFLEEHFQMCKYICSHQKESQKCAEISNWYVVIQSDMSNICYTVFVRPSAYIYNHSIQ